MNTGIYVIECICNGLLYVGQAVSIKQREKEHSRKLRGNYHPNYKLQSDFNLYGESAFVFKIVCYCSIYDLDSYESFCIEQYNSIEKGYNLTSGGQGGLMSNENKTQRRLGKPGKQVFGYSIEGEMLKKWVSIKHCAQELKVNPCDVRRTIKGEQRFCKGFVLSQGTFEPPRERVVRSRDSSGKYIKRNTDFIDLI